MATIIQLRPRKKGTNVQAAVKHGAKTVPPSIKELEQELKDLGSKYGYNNLRVKLKANNDTAILCWTTDDGIAKFRVEKYVVPSTNAFYCQTYYAIHLKSLIAYLGAFGHLSSGYDEELW